MKCVGIIPARLEASRYPNKPLELIHGMPMVGHCYHRTRLALGESATYVATCDTQIADYIIGIGGKVIMTSKNHTRATSRTAEAIEYIESLNHKLVEIVVMVQGDEPLIMPKTISQSLECFSDPEIEIVNIMSKFRSEALFRDHNNVKVVVNQKMDALYFSREPIPSPWRGIDGVPMYMQTGIIAFRKEALMRFNRQKETLLEQVESIDMNRIIELGGKVRMVLTDAYTLGVDTPEELMEAAKMLEFDETMNFYLHQ
jgi:3-deoxy-manno-octulosonate cytidylyltransferase (CMP-KDO synthetase)